jgi:hypothetical protein
VDGAGALLVDADGVRLRLSRLEDDLLEVEDDVGHVLDDVADGRELVERALDADAVMAAPWSDERRMRRSELPR